MSEGLRFVDELPVRNTSGSGIHAVTKRRAAALKANAGKWAEWPTKTARTTLGKSLNRPELAGAGTFEIESRNRALYVRFVAPALPEEASNGNGHADPHRDPTPEEIPTAVSGPPEAVAAVHHVPTGGETVAVYDDEGDLVESDVHLDKAWAESPERDRAAAAVSASAYRPKVKCLGCKTYLVVETGKTEKVTLKEHAAESPSCKAAVTDQLRHK